MKTSRYTSSLCLAAILALPVVAPADPAALNWTLSEADGNSRTWVAPADPGQPPHKVVELASGMNYWDGQQWNPSVPSFEVNGNYFEADKVQTPISLSADLNVIGAVITVTPTGNTLSSTPVAIALYNAANGDTLVIGTITNCTGVLVSSNQVDYQNAFSGVCADVLYTLNCGSFQQDVVLTGRLNPADYGFPTNTTRIQILTEFYQAPRPEKVDHPIYVEKNPAIRNSMVSPDLMDERLDFGQLVFARGKAYTSATYPRGGAPVGKEYKTMSGRAFLIETVRYSTIEKGLESLPDCNGAVNSTRLMRGRAGSYAGIPRPGTIAQAKASRSVAVLNRRPGMVIDYVAVSGGLSNPYTFHGDTTYLISGWVEGDTVTIEGGAVLKYPAGYYNTLFIDDALNCATSEYRPAIFTGVDDDSVGQSMNGVPDSGYTGTINSNGYGNPMIWDATDGPMTISNCRFCYAQTAIVPNLGGSYLIFKTINDSQFVNSICGLQNLGCGGSGIVLNFNNCLMAGVQYPTGGFSYYGADIVLFQCTIANGVGFVNGGVDRLTAYNSIFVNMTGLTNGAGYNAYMSMPVYGSDNGFYNSEQFGGNQFTSPVYPFQTVGGGSYYLTNGCGFQNEGIATNPPDYDLWPVSVPSVLADIATKTTHPPLIYSNMTISVNTNLSQQAPWDTGTPDLGYHYDPIDYIVDKLTVTNATLTLNNAVVLASDNMPGIQLKNGGAIVSISTPLYPNWFVRGASVQEGPALGSSPANGITVGSATNGNVTGTFQFSKFSCPANGGYHLYDASTSTYTNLWVRDCEFWSGANNLSGTNKTATATLLNDLFWRSTMFASNTSSLFGLFLTNNLFWGVNSVTLSQPSGGQWNAFNNDFDTCTITNSTLTNGYNAYLACSGYLHPTNVTDIFSNNTLGYESGPLGTFYQPTNSLLINRGNTNANVVGLGNYTVTTNLVGGLEVPEGTNIVSIGYHYPATDALGNPIVNGTTGTDFWLTFLGAYDFPMYLSLYISCPIGATGAVTCLGVPGYSSVAVTGCGDATVNGTYVPMTVQLSFGEIVASYVKGSLILFYDSTDYWWLWDNDSATMLYDGPANFDGLNGGTWTVDQDSATPTPTTYGGAEVPFSQAFSAEPGTVADLLLPLGATNLIYGAVATNSIEVTASQPVSVYAMNFSYNASTAFTGYPKTFLGTNYCVMARPASIPAYGEPIFYSQLAIVATASNTTVSITPSPTADLMDHPGTNTYTITNLQAGETYQINSIDNGEGDNATNDVTGTRITATQPIALFAGVNLAFVPDTNTAAGNPLEQEQIPVADWGTNVVALSFAGRTNGDTYRVLAAYSNTVVTISGNVVTVVSENPDTYGPWTVTTNYEVVTVTTNAGQFYDIIVDGPVQFQASQPIQVAQFANGWESDNSYEVYGTGAGGYGDPCEILLPPAGQYLYNNTIYVPTGGELFDENYLNLIVAQTAINNTFLDGSLVPAGSFVPIGDSGYYGAQIPLFVAGSHTVTSSQPVEVQVYGFGDVDDYYGLFDAYSYFGGTVP